MKKFKRLLCMALTVVVIFSILLINAEAIFKDQSNISHKEAVEIMADLNIINGKENGCFDPDGYITRAEMCKMICVALSGGRVPTLNTKTTPSYTDTHNHWAEVFIEFCSSMGIVNGNANGTFAPDACITGEQASKMMLRTMGYDTYSSKFTGDNWSYWVNERATTEGLYKDMLIDYSAPLSRDDAAQLVFNSIMAPTAKYTLSVDPLTEKPIYGYALTGKSIYTRCYNHKQIATDATTQTNIDMNAIKYKTLFLDLLGKSIDIAKDKLGQPIETICYDKDEFGLTYYADVYPSFMIIYTNTQKIDMINITSEYVCVESCKYGMKGSQIIKEIGEPTAIGNDDMNNEQSYIYDFENGEKKLFFVFTDNSFRTIKNIHLSLAD